MKKTAILGMLALTVGCQSAPKEPVIADNMIELTVFLFLSAKCTVRPSRTNGFETACA